MGIIRKTMSISTLGVVDLRSDKERIARSTRHTAKALKDQNKLIRAQNSQANLSAAMQAQGANQPSQFNRQVVAPMVASPPAGWFEDPGRADGLRWWDGSQWTEHRKANQQ
jgi:hypothetical protein